MENIRIRVMMIKVDPDSFLEEAGTEGEEEIDTV